MALFETGHPLAQEVAVIMHAAEQGLGRSDFLPAHTIVGYASPLDTADGAAKLSIADKHTENFGVIHMPVFSKPDSELVIVDQGGAHLTDARIVIADFNGEDFGIPLGDEILTTPKIQFDVYPEGVIFSALLAGSNVNVHGEFESELYDSWANMARTQIGLPTIYGAAIQFLDQVA